MSRGFRPYSKILLSTIKKFFSLARHVALLSRCVFDIILQKNIVLSIAAHKIIVFVLDNYNEIWYTVCVIKIRRNLV